MSWHSDNENRFAILACKRKSFLMSQSKCQRKPDFSVFLNKKKHSIWCDLTVWYQQWTWPVGMFFTMCERVCQPVVILWHVLAWHKKMLSVDSHTSKWWSHIQCVGHAFWQRFQNQSSTLVREHYTLLKLFNLWKASLEHTKLAWAECLAKLSDPQREILCEAHYC